MEVNEAVKWETCEGRREYLDDHPNEKEKAVLLRTRDVISFIFLRYLEFVGRSNL